MRATTLLRWYLGGMVAFLVVLALPAWGWTPGNQVAIAESGAQLGPPDLVRQIAKNRAEFRKGVMAPFQDGDGARHMKNSDGSGELDRVIAYEVDGAVKAIRAHRPFSEVVYRLGVVSHYVADANDPLSADASDTQEGRYFRDFALYVESATPRVQTVFYGLRPELQRGADLSPLVSQALERGRRFYPLIGREYRRIGWGQGRQGFDDRSTAFGVAALSLSHALTDVAEALRFIWLRAGGADERRMPVRGQQVVLVPLQRPEKIR